MDPSMGLDDILDVFNKLVQGIVNESVSESYKANFT